MPNIGSLNVTHNFAGNAFNYVIMQLVKSVTPLAEIERVVYPAPFSQQTHLFENLQPVWHLIRFWSSTDGVTLDTEILTIAGNARSGALYPISTYEYVVGRGESEPGVWADPVQDDIGIRDTRLLNQLYWIEERGTGSLLTAEYVDRSDVGGGWDFSLTGKVMEEGGVYIVRAISRVDITGDSSDSGADTGDDIFMLTTNQDYDNTLHSGKRLLADFSSQVGILTIPNLALVPDGSFKLYTHTGLQRNVTVQFDAGDTVEFRKQAVNSITLGEGEFLEIVFHSGIAYAFDYNTNHFRLGQRIWSDIRDILNVLIADGGQYNQADYPRAVEMLDSLPIGAVVDYTTWNTSTVINSITVYPNKGKFARDDVGGTFKVPDMRSQMIKALSATDGSVVAGRYENQDTIAHYHFIATGGDGAGDYLSANHGAGGNSSYSLNQSPTVPANYRTSTAGSGDNKVNNIGLYPLICI